MEIPLGKCGKNAIVDDEDAHLAKFVWWGAKSRDGVWYARRDERRAPLKPLRFHLHREVLGVTDPLVFVDHRNGDGLDCRRANLRPATRAENSRNQTKRAAATSKFKGVSWVKRTKAWFVSIGWRENGRQISKYVGYYKDEVEAARAYDEAARREFGEFARLNFPNQES